MAEHSTSRRRSLASAGWALGAALLLAACTGPNDVAPTVTGEPAPSVSPSEATESGETSSLLPVYPAEWTLETATAESARVAAEIVALVDPALVLNDDHIEQQAPAETPETMFYGVLDTLTLDPSVDANDQAKRIVGTLRTAGWIGRSATNEEGTYFVALVSGEDPATSWLVAVGSDTSVEGQSVVSIQLASPTLP